MTNHVQRRKGAGRTLRVGSGIVAAGLIGWLVGSAGVETPNQAARRSAPPVRTAVTTRVERVALAERVITRSTVESAGSIEYFPASGSAGGSRLEVLYRTGDTVGAGDVVALVDSRPVIILSGDAQLGADVRPDSRGRDVDRLQSGLRGLGFAIPGTEAGVAGPATRLGIAELYQRAGFLAPTTVEGSGGLEASGGESLGERMSRLRRAVNDAEASLRAAEAGAAGIPDPVAPANAALETAKRKLAEAQTDRAVAVGDALETLSAAQKAERDAGSTTTTTAAAGEGADAIGTAVSQVKVAERALRDAQRRGDAVVADAYAQVVLAQLSLVAAERSWTASKTAAAQQISIARSAHDSALEALANAELRDGPIAPRSEILFVPNLPTTVLSVADASAGNGFVGPQSGGPLFSLRSGNLQVSASMPAGARLGQGATGVAESDDGAVVLEVAALEGGASNDSPAGTGGPTLGPGSTSNEARFAITRIVRGNPTPGMSLRATFSTPVTGGELVLAVPLRAIATDGRGQSFVRVADRSGFRRVNVHLGRTGSGMVELLGPDGDPLESLPAGTMVRVS